MEDIYKKLNVKAYVMTIKEEEALNQWLDKQLKVGLIVESKSRYVISYFYILKKDRSNTELLEIEPVYDKRQDTITLNWESDSQAQRDMIF